MILTIFEGIIFSFVLLMICVIDIQNGPVGGVHFYEQDVKDRVVELGLITKKEIKKNLMLSGAPLWIYMIFLMPMAAMAETSGFYASYSEKMHLTFQIIE